MAYQPHGPQHTAQGHCNQAWYTLMALVLVLQMGHLLRLEEHWLHVHIWPHAWNTMLLLFSRHMIHSLSLECASSLLSWSTLPLPLACAASLFSLPAAAFCSLCAALRRSASSLRCLQQHPKDDDENTIWAGWWSILVQSTYCKLTEGTHETWSVKRHEAQHE